MVRKKTTNLQRKSQKNNEIPKTMTLKIILIVRNIPYFKGNTQITDRTSPRILKYRRF